MCSTTTRSYLLDPLKENLKTKNNPASLLMNRFKSEWNSDIKKVIEQTRQ